MNEIAGALGVMTALLGGLAAVIVGGVIAYFVVRSRGAMRGR